MLSSYACPACSADDWLAVERFVFLRQDHQRGHARRRWEVLLRKAMIAVRAVLLARPRRSPIRCRFLDAYSRLRREIMFRVWVPDHDELELTSQCCRRCGFMAYRPRPDEKEIETRYMQLKQHEPDIGGQDMSKADEIAMDRARAERICRTAMVHFPERVNLRVLDYGGGNGKLLMPFLELGHRCDLVDYSDRQLPGVNKIANDMAGIPSGARYDVIVCSHVLEHLADPGSLLQQLKGILADGGIVYAEVPQEIWAGIPIDADPVTHVNFFQESSFRRLFESRGFKLINGRREICTYGVHLLEAVWLVACRSDARPAEPAFAGCRENNTPDLLYPSRLYSAQRLWRLYLWPRLRQLARKATLVRGKGSPQTTQPGSTPSSPLSSH